MNDNKSSKQINDGLPAVLRRRHEALRADGYNEQTIGCLSTAAKEIERLTARVATQESCIAVNVREYLKLEAQRDRLRAALEKILVGTCDDPKCMSMFHEGCDLALSAEQRNRNVAREALRGADTSGGSHG